VRNADFTAMSRKEMRNYFRFEWNLIHNISGRYGNIPQHAIPSAIRAAQCIQDARDIGSGTWHNVRRMQSNKTEHYGNQIR